MTLSREAVGRSEQQEKHQDTKVTKQTLDSFVSFVLFVFFPQPTRLMTGVKRARASIEVIANRPKNRTEKWPKSARLLKKVGEAGRPCPGSCATSRASGLGLLWLAVL